MEFFDRYLEWDALKIGMHDEIVTPIRTIDLFTANHSSSVNNSFGNFYTLPVRRSLERVYDPTAFAIS